MIIIDLHPEEHPGHVVPNQGILPLSSVGLPLFTSVLCPDIRIVFLMDSAITDIIMVHANILRDDHDYDGTLLTL